MSPSVGARRPRRRVAHLRTVIGFEFSRTIRKPSFWIGTLALPVLVIVVGVLVGVGSAAGGSSAAASSAAQKTPFEYVDHSGLVSEQVAARWGGTPTSDAASAERRVVDGDLRAFIVFPTDPSRTAVTVAAQDRGLFENNAYSSLATRVLEQSVAQHVGDAESVRILRSPPDATVTAYADGRVAPGWLSIIPPALYAAAFFGLVLLLAARMVTVVVEEKENRISEMVLTAIDAGTLIRGKVLAMLLVGLVQVGVFVVPALAATGVLLPALARRLGPVPIDPWRMLVGALLLIGGVLLASALFVCVGAAVPTIKDASTLQTVALFALIIPVYAAVFVITTPHSPVSAVFTYFPTFTPLTAMVRNAVGSLSPLESTICVVELFVAAGLVLRFAEFLFRHSVAQYGAKVSFRQVLAWRRARTAG